MEVDDRVEKLLAKRSGYIKKVAVGTSAIALGKYAIALLTAQGDISVSSLKSFITNEIETSPSSQGKCNPEQDFQRTSAQEALDLLESLLAAHGRR